MNRSDYTDLPARFFARIAPTPVAAPRLIKFNHPLAAELGLEAGEESAGRGADAGDAVAGDADGTAAIFSGNTLPPGADPIAMAYAGHQFGQFVPQLGDGRALLLGEARNRAGVRRDIQLKGSGRTPWSRGGDGRAALGPVLREYLVSEAMHALGIPATRALAAVATGESVYREAALPGAILTRVAASFVRVGTFQYFAARGDTEAVRLLADYVINRHFPGAGNDPQPCLALLRGVTAAQASLIAGWMNVGFIHGVMNTDNMSISGETIDFGPCAFMDAYDPATVFSSIDRFGRYAYANQPHAAAWNLARFAETLLPLIDPEPERALQLAGDVIAAFSTQFSEHRLEGLRRKIGLSACEAEDPRLLKELLEAMHRGHADFTLTFRALCDAAEDEAGDAAVRALFAEPQPYDAWSERWRARLAREPPEPRARAAAMRAVNPAFIPRNHQIERVIAAATTRGDFGPFEELSSVLLHPYRTQDRFKSYALAPQPEERVLQTFCGT
jgi:uncharacterized protein YdiU (UPF0061 family)